MNHDCNDITPKILKMILKDYRLLTRFLNRDNYKIRACGTFF